jgi:hypothetical protein
MCQCQVVSGNVIDEGIKFAKAVAHKPLTTRRTSELPVKGLENAAKLREGLVH